MYKEYVSKKFSKGSMAIINQANDIIEYYKEEYGLNLTLRQLYYQFVSKALIANKQSEYKRLGSIISDARLAGLIDWTAIEDRTRNLIGNTHWKDPGHIIGAAAGGFQLNHWKGQEYHVEVWIEKDALTGVIASICDELDVDYFACKGYVSQSEMHSAAMRLKRYLDRGQQPVIVHLGDHDPSGIDMTRDIIDRHDVFNVKIELERIALNMNQVDEYNPPPNPAKITDSRASGYIDKHGYESWELDALEPSVMSNLIKDTVISYRDQDIYDDVMKEEREHLEILARVEKEWRTL